MNGFKRICAVIMGMVLLIAGILKMMDPVGSGLVMDEYFKFFHLGFLKPASRIIATAFALIESLLGAALISGVWRKTIAIISGILMVFFTAITIFLYIAHPAMDCGCFGEAVHLNHAQTLLKNLILDALWCLAFIPLGKLGLPQRIKYVSFSLAAISLVLFLLFSALSIPLRDYTKFKPGTELDETTLSFYDANYNYVDSLALEGDVMLISAYDADKFGKEETERVTAFAEQASANGFTVLFLVVSTPDEISEKGFNPVLLTFTYFGDRKELMTLNRSNGGVTYISDGQIIRKWAYRNLPNDNLELTALKSKAPMDVLLARQNRTRALFQGFTLYLFAVLLLL
ncbi:MAG: hypothetical protein IKZ60_01645 [Bacteroidales bacterium]|nr:hypothetical protein [Bacteroidales bacterium]